MRKNRKIRGVKKTFHLIFTLFSKLIYSKLVNINIINNSQLKNLKYKYYNLNNALNFLKLDVTHILYNNKLNLLLYIYILN
jgi:predicted Zn-dependent protease